MSVGGWIGLCCCDAVCSVVWLRCLVCALVAAVQCSLFWLWSSVFCGHTPPQPTAATTTHTAPSIHTCAPLVTVVTRTLVPAATARSCSSSSATAATSPLASALSSPLGHSASAPPPPPLVMHQHKPTHNSNHANTVAAAAAGAGIGVGGAAAAGQTHQAQPPLPMQAQRKPIPLPLPVHREWDEALAVLVARDTLQTVTGSWCSEAQLMGQTRHDDAASAAAAAAPASSSALISEGMFAAYSHSQFFALFKSSPEVRGLSEAEQLELWREAMGVALVELRSNSPHANQVMHRPDGIKPMCIQYASTQQGAGSAVTHWRVVRYAQDECRCGELSQRRTNRTDELNGLRPEVIKMLTKGNASHAFYSLSELSARFLQTHPKLPADSIARVPHMRNQHSSVQLSSFGARAAAGAAANPYYHGTSLSTLLWLEELLAHDLQSHAMLLDEGMRIELRWAPRANGAQVAAAAFAAEELQVSWIPVSEMEARLAVPQARIVLPAVVNKVVPKAAVVPRALPAVPAALPAAAPLSTDALRVVLTRRKTDDGFVYDHAAVKPSKLNWDSDSEASEDSPVVSVRASKPSALHRPEVADQEPKVDRATRAVKSIKPATDSGASPQASNERRWCRLVPPPGAPPLPVQLPKSHPDHKASVAEYNRIYGKYYRASRNKRQSDGGAAAAGPQRDSEADYQSVGQVLDGGGEAQDAADKEHVAAGVGAGVLPRVKRGTMIKREATRSKTADSSDDSEFVADDDDEMNGDEAIAKSHSLRRRVRRVKASKKEESPEEEEEDASESEQEEQSQSSDEASDSKAAPRPSDRASQRTQGTVAMTADALREAEEAFRKEEAANEAAGVRYSAESRPDLKTQIMLRRPMQCSPHSAGYLISSKAYATFRRRTVGNTKRSRKAPSDSESEEAEEEEEEEQSSNDSDSDAEMDESESDEAADVSDSAAERPARGRRHGNRSSGAQEGGDRSAGSQSASKPASIASSKKRQPLPSSFVNPLNGQTMHKPSRDGVDPETYRKLYRSWYDLGRTLRIEGFPPRPEDYQKQGKKSDANRSAKGAAAKNSADESAAAAAAPPRGSKTLSKSSFGPPGGASLHAPSTPASSTATATQRRRAPNIAVDGAAAAAEPATMAVEGDDGSAVNSLAPGGDFGAAAGSPLPPPYAHVAADPPAAAAGAVPAAPSSHKRKAGDDNAAGSQGASSAVLLPPLFVVPVAPPQKKAKKDPQAAAAADPAARIAAAVAAAAAAAAAEDAMHDERKEEVPPTDQINGAGVAAAHFAHAPVLSPAAAAAAAPAIAAATGAPVPAEDPLEPILLRVYRGDALASTAMLVRFRAQWIDLESLESDFASYFPDRASDSLLEGLLPRGLFIPLKNEIKLRMAMAGL